MCPRAKSKDEDKHKVKHRVDMRDTHSNEKEIDNKQVQNKLSHIKYTLKDSMNRLQHSVYEIRQNLAEKDD